MFKKIIQQNNDFTIIIPANFYPLAEISICLLNYFYPQIKILISYDKKVDIINRKKIISRFNNVSFVRNKFNLGHGKQLNYLINFVNTKYFITYDDDSFMWKYGIIEFINEVINENDFIINIQSTVSFKNDSGKRLNNLSIRALPCFSVGKTEIFLKYNMSFENSMYNISKKNNILFDVGSFVLSDIMRYNLLMKIINITDVSDYINHIEYLSFIFSKFNYYNVCDNFNKIQPVSLQKIKNYQNYELDIQKKFNLIQRYINISNIILEKNLKYPDDYQIMFSNHQDIFYENYKNNIDIKKML